MRTSGEKRPPGDGIVPDQLVRRVAERIGAQRRDQQLLLELLIQELVALDVSNRRTLRRLEQDAVALYESMRSTLSPEDKNAFLLAILDDVRGIADQKRGELRAIVRRYVQNARNGSK